MIYAIYTSIFVPSESVKLRPCHVPKRRARNRPPGVNLDVALTS